MGPNWELISDAINSTLKIKVSACCFENLGILCKFLTEWYSYTSFDNNVVSILVNCFTGYCCPIYYFPCNEHLGFVASWLICSLFDPHLFIFQCIYRNPSECKERHKILMDKTASDGADSAEDSGTSQSYPSTLPGIPKVFL